MIKVVKREKKHCPNYCEFRISEAPLYSKPSLTRLQLIRIEIWKILSRNEYMYSQQRRKWYGGTGHVHYYTQTNASWLVWRNRGDKGDVHKPGGQKANHYQLEWNTRYAVA
jgi:hypothetical protein